MSHVRPIDFAGCIIRHMTKAVYSVGRHAPSPPSSTSPAYMFKPTHLRIINRYTLTYTGYPRKSPTNIVTQVRNMSNNEEKDKITSWASKDGSFKRQTSAFRDSIEKGGKFEPEKGKSYLQRGGRLQR